MVGLEERQSLLVIGATQTGKTTGLAVPAILEADEFAVIAISVKDDLVSDTIGWRSRLAGCHYVFDPTNALQRNDQNPAAGARAEGSVDEVRRAQVRARAR